MSMTQLNLHEIENVELFIAPFLGDEFCPAFDVLKISIKDKNEEITTIQLFSEPGKLHHLVPEQFHE